MAEVKQEDDCNIVHDDENSDKSNSGSAFNSVFFINDLS